MTRIRLENITKSFGSTTVVRDLNLTIEAGDFFTFVGPSGCGKSTILNMIAGLEEVSDGRVFFDEKSINDLSPEERDVAMVFQSYALYPHMTAYENIAFPLMMKKQDRNAIDGEVRRVTEILGIQDLLERRPKDLSGGQRQRVALGRAIIRKPKVFLMDEPLSNLDARLRIEMQAELKRLHQELGITTVYVTHDQAEAMGLSDRIAVLHEGKVQQIGIPIEVYKNPGNIFVAGFIGSPPMNFIECSVRTLRPLEIDCNGMVLRPVPDGVPVADRVIMGIRPEDAAVSGRQTEGDWKVTVSLLETVGPFNWVVCLWRDRKLRGIASADEDLKIGSTAFLRFSPNKAVIFDGETGKRI